MCQGWRSEARPGEGPPPRRAAPRGYCLSQALPSLRPPRPSRTLLLCGPCGRDGGQGKPRPMGLGRAWEGVPEIRGLRCPGPARINRVISVGRRLPEPARASCSVFFLHLVQQMLWATAPQALPSAPAWSLKPAPRPTGDRRLASLGRLQPSCDQCTGALRGGSCSRRQETPAQATQGAQPTAAPTRQGTLALPTRSLAGQRGSQELSQHIQSEPVTSSGCQPWGDPGSLCGPHRRASFPAPCFRDLGGTGKRVGGQGGGVGCRSRPE